MKNRRKFTPQFKAEVVLDVLSGASSPAELCRKHSLNPNLLSQWKAAFLQRAPLVFQADAAVSADAARLAELEQCLGRFAIENEVLKKALRKLA